MNGKTEQIFESRIVEGEGKRFVLEYGCNRRGKFFRIVEESNGKRSTVMVPQALADEVLEKLDEIVPEGKQ